MYEGYWSLEESPFRLTPDPRFLLRSKMHHDVLTSLVHGITSHKGILALVGDVGTGKTTLCRALLRELPEEVQTALVLTPHLDPGELLRALLEDLGVPVAPDASRGELMMALGRHVLGMAERGKTVVAILDEAQQLPAEALEQIRVLSNLETPTRKLLQVVLVGQPELEERLRRRELRQLDQRIAIRCWLRPLSRKETARYIEHRLRVAGLLGPQPFTPAAIALVHHESRGIPRVINLLCDRSLLTSWMERSREVTPAHVRATLRSVMGASGRRRRAPWRPARLGRSGAAAAAALLLASGAGFYWLGWPAGPGGLGAAPALAGGPAPPAIVLPVGEGLTPPAPGPDPSEGRGDAQAGPGHPIDSLLAEWLHLWGVTPAGSGEDPWPRAAGGGPDLARVAGRHELSATRLEGTSLAELRAIGLPALLEVEGPQGMRPYLLRGVERADALLLTPAGDRIRMRQEELGPGHVRAAWILWRNVDLLPADPSRAMSETVAATLALRLHKLGYLDTPLGDRTEDDLRGAVRRFQQARGLAADGVAGPRTTLALAQATSGRLQPRLLERAGP